MATLKAAPFDSAAAIAPAPPCEFFVFDVETMNPPAAQMEKLEADFLAEWEPGQLKDPEKIVAKKIADMEKFRSKAALLDAAPVAMVGLMFDEETYLLHGLKTAKAKWFGRRENRVAIEGFKNEAALMRAVSNLLGKKTSAESMGVGHNIYGFDLPKMRLATVRNGIDLPEALRVKLVEDDDRQRMLDTMKHFCRYFARNGELFIKQETMLERLGLDPMLKGVATGADVPGLLAAGKITEVATKLLADLVGVRQAFLRMTGRA